MSVNLYQTGVSGLLTAQQQLASTSNNIANVNTEGYSRQRTEQETSVALVQGGLSIGTGTGVSDIVRIYDEFAFKEQLISTSNLGNATSSAQNLDQLNSILNFSGTALTDSVNSLYQSINGLADNPSSEGLRDIVLSQGEIVTTNFQSLSQNFDSLQSQINGEIDQITERISDIGASIAELNEQILDAGGSILRGQPNNLLDTRDALITELSEYTTVNTVPTDNNLVIVLIGGGNTLVTGTTALSLEAVSGDPDSLQREVNLVGTNSSIAVNSNLLGGSLQAKLEFRDEDLTEARNSIDRLALAISDQFNQIQSQGLDATEQQGSDFFTDINSTLLQESRALAFSDNASSLTAQVEITDASLILTDAYEVEFNGSDFNLTNLSTGDTETLVLVPPSTNTFSSSQGFNFTLAAGTAVNEDKFVIRPSANSAALIDVQLSNGRGIATSSPITVTPSADNISSGGISISEIFDPQAAQTDFTIDILETSTGVFSFTVTDSAGVTSAPQSYSPPSQLVDLPLSPATAALQIEIEGTPSGINPNAPERFVLSDGFGPGNSTNILALALTQEEGFIDSGTQTFNESLSNIISQVGSSASSSELRLTTAESLFTQAFNRNQSISGVNLDEEAANLIQFQQAFQASSQIISIANTLFDTLLSVAN